MIYLPFGYEKINSATWMFLTSLLAIGLYFKFNRFWSVRNLDLVLLTLLGPGMVLALEGHGLRLAEIGNLDETATVFVPESTELEPADVDTGDQPPAPDAVGLSGEQVPDQLKLALTKPSECSWMNSHPGFRNAVLLERFGYVWLFAIGVLFTVRLLIDSGFQRRPLLEPNLNSSGLAFLGVALLGFLLVDIVQTQVEYEDESGPDRLMQLVSQRTNDDEDAFKQFGPGYYLLHSIPSIPTFVNREGISIPDVNRAGDFYSQRMKFIAKLMAVLCQVGIVAGIFLIAHWHFGNTKLAISVTTLYLLLPFTGQLGGRVFHVLPALLLLWAVVCYRRPTAAGVLLGLAAGVFYYPMFLIPLWLSFYWERGRMAFLIGFLASLAMVIGSLVFVSEDLQSFATQVRQVFGFWLPQVVGVQGIWALGWNPIYRIPLLVAFVGLAISFAFWPVPKNLGSLISCTAATMVVVQFCHGFGGGMYIAWYLPLLLLTIFRPNLSDRVAVQDVILKTRKRRPAEVAPAA